MIFLLTPLREGRLEPYDDVLFFDLISTHAPAGGATELTSEESASELFLLTPLREGRLRCRLMKLWLTYFYSRPCGRGDLLACWLLLSEHNFYSRPCGRGD